MKTSHAINHVRVHTIPSSTAATAAGTLAAFLIVAAALGLLIVGWWHTETVPTNSRAQAAPTNWNVPDDGRGRLESPGALPWPKPVVEPAPAAQE